jgi:hypothetical protein
LGTLQVAVPPNPYVLALQPPLLVMLAAGIPTPEVIGTRSPSPKPVMVAPPAAQLPDAVGAFSLNVMEAPVIQFGKVRMPVRLA